MLDILQNVQIKCLDGTNCIEFLNAPPLELCWVFFCCSLWYVRIFIFLLMFLLFVFFTTCVWVTVFYVFEAFLDEAERKYLFECDSEEQCNEWIDAIVKAR